MAARRLSAEALRKGYKLSDLHEYKTADGSAWCWRIRCDHPNGDKWMRPMRWNGTGYELGEPPAPRQGKPLYRLPELLAADLAARVWIVEGEKCADALAQIGVTVTTSGSCSSADAADWTPLRNRTCIVWPDSDNAGAKYADAVTAKLHALGCSVEIIDVAALAMPDKGDCVDWLAVNPKATNADVDTLPRVVRNAPMRTAPEPLRRPVPAPEPYPIADLGPILRPACEAIRRVIQAPDAVCGASLLAAASLAVQGFADVVIDGRVHPLSLWFLTVAESGERKSAVDAEAMRAAREHEKKLALDYADAVDAHDAETEQWNVRKEAAKGAAKKNNGDGLADALRQLGPAPAPPLRPNLIAADFTAEGLAKLLAIGRPSIGAFTDEAALVFGGHGMTKETVTRTAGTLSKLWDSGSLDRIRASDGAVKLYGRRLALHLMAQPVIAERALSDDVLAGQGFLARCLLAWPESTAGTRPYCAESLRDNADMLRFTTRAADLFARPLPIADGERNELAPRTLPLSVDGKTAWLELYNAIESAMAPTRRYASVKAWASKTPEQCLRIAGVLTLFENPDAQTIEAVTIERASEIAVWHLNEATRLAGTAALSPEVRDAEALLDWCHATRRNKLHSRAALQFGPARIRELGRFTQAMGELERAGWAHKIDGGAELDGAHRRQVWSIVPQSDGNH